MSKSRVIQAVLFDLFGTLIPYPDEATLPQRLSAQAARLGLFIGEQSFRTALPVLERRMEELQQKDNRLQQGAWCHSEAYWQLWHTQLLQILKMKGDLRSLGREMANGYVLDQAFVPDPQAIETLTILRARGLKLGTVSNCATEAHQVLHRSGLGKLLDSVVISAQVGLEKPHPQIYHHALQQMQVEADQAIFVGDSYEADVVGANRAGLTGVLFLIDGGRNRPHWYNGYQIRQLSYLPRLLESELS